MNWNEFKKWFWSIKLIDELKTVDIKINLQGEGISTEEIDLAEQHLLIIGKLKFKYFLRFLMSLCIVLGPVFLALICSFSPFNMPLILVKAFVLTGIVSLIMTFILCETLLKYQLRSAKKQFHLNVEGWESFDTNNVINNPYAFIDFGLGEMKDYKTLIGMWKESETIKRFIGAAIKKKKYITVAECKAAEAYWVNRDNTKAKSEILSGIAD